MANLAIKGHATRGKEVIEILEMLGGKNIYSHFGETESYFFFIQDGIIDCDEVRYADGYIIYTIEEFLEKFPYKVCDNVQHNGATSCGTVYIIERIKWANNHIEYEIRPLYDYNHTGLVTVCAEDLQPYKEETMAKANKAVFDANSQCCDIMNHLIKEKTMADIIKINIPKGYEFAGVDDDSQQVVLEKIGYHYPNTYEECCKVLKIEYPYFKTEEDGISASTYKNKLFGYLKQLLICRDAYWKLAGEEMGLGKPWEPNWSDESEDKYTIVAHSNPSCYANCRGACGVLTFPTAEMRDAFYENFKDLIEQCKELL